MEITKELETTDTENLKKMSKAAKTKMPATASDEALIERYLSLRAYQSILNAITDHGKYESPDGKNQTSAKGFSININKKVKKLFNCGVKELIEFEDVQTLTRMREAAARAILRGEKLMEVHDQIKADTYEALEAAFKLYSSK